MTDAVFGGLRYFDGVQGGIALHWMLPDIVPSGSFLDLIELWPKENNVEPDVVVDLITPDEEKLRVIIEAKWLDNVLGADQLDKEWREFGPGAKGAPAKVRHILLVQRRIRVEPLAYFAAAADIRQFRHLLTWRDIAAAAGKRNASQGNQQIQKWITDVVRVINLGDGRTFTGWTNLPTIDEQPSLFQSRFWATLDEAPAVLPPTPFFDQGQR